MRGLIRLLDIGSAFISRYLTLAGGIYCGLLMLAIVADVTGRYVFDRPLQVVATVIAVTAPLLFSMGLGYAQVTRSHIRLTIFTRRLKPRPQKTLEIGVLVISTLAIGLLTWLTADYAMESWHIREYEVGFVRIPIYPTKVMLSVSISLLWLRYLVDLLRHFNSKSTELRNNGSHAT